MSSVNQLSIKEIQQKKEKRVEYKGLCSTCKKAPTCTFPRDPNRPVLQCNEFEGYKYTQREKILSNTKSKMKLSTPDKDKSTYKGLCKICDKRKSCTYPKPESGVWHCEEYC